MKKIFGFIIARLGACLWEKGGFWNESNRYEDLTVFGKLGYNLFIKGLHIAGVEPEDLEVMFADL